MERDPYFRVTYKIKDNLTKQLKSPIHSRKAVK